MEEEGDIIGRTCFNYCVRDLAVCITELYMVLSYRDVVRMQVTGRFAYDATHQE